MERVGRPVVVGVLAVLLAVALGAAHLRQRDDIPLGDRGHVTGVVDPDCNAIDIHHDGLILRNQGEVPTAWRGDEVEGELVLDEHTDAGGEERVAGTFTADGTVLRIDGGPEGGTFFQASCALWSGDGTPGPGG